MTPEQAAMIQPGDVVYLRENRQHYVVGNVKPTGIAAPLFRLERIGGVKPNWDGAPTDDPDIDPGMTSYRLCDLPHEGQPTRAPYRGGKRYSARTLRERGERLHPIPDEPERPDERYLDGPALRARRDALGLTQSALARALGVEPNTIARWEQGNRPISNPVMVGLALQTLERYRG